MPRLYKKIKQISFQKKEQKFDYINKLFISIDNDNYDFFSRSLKKLESPVDLNSENPSGWTPLMLAVYLGKKQMVYDLIARGCNPYYQSTHDGWNTLMIAIENQEEDLVNEFLKYDGDLDLKTFKGTSALNLAVIRPNLNIVSSLLKAGASVNEVTGYRSFRTAIILASDRGRLSNVKEILKYKPDLNFKMKGSELTALMVAVIKNHYQIVKLLLKQEKIDINLKSSCGKDAMQFAIDNRNSQIIVLLAISGANFSEKSQVDVNFEERGDKIFRLTWGRVPPVPMDSPALL